MINAKGNAEHQKRLGLKHGGGGRGGGCFNKHPTGKGILWRKPETPKWKVQKKKTNERRDEKLGGNRVV